MGALSQRNHTVLTWEWVGRVEFPVVRMRGPRQWVALRFPLYGRRRFQGLIPLRKLLGPRGPLSRVLGVPLPAQGLTLLQANASGGEGCVPQIFVSRLCLFFISST